MDYKHLLFKEKDRVAWVRINRPEQRNALNMEALRELLRAFEYIHASEDIKLAVLTGTGKAFVGGGDIKEMADMAPSDYMVYGDLYAALTNKIRENAKPVIGAANGYAMGGGNLLLLSTDYIVAVDTAKFALPEIHLGIFGGPVVLSRLVGRYLAAELTMFGDRYTAQRAYEMGLCNQVVPEAEFDAAVAEAVEKLLAKSSFALLHCKKALNAGLKYDFSSAMEYQQALMAMLYSGHDQKEGMRAFIEKRPPEYTGK